MLLPPNYASLLRYDVARDTVVCSTADSYIDLAVQGPGCVAKMAVSRKEAKYVTLQTHYDFQLIAVDTLVLSMSPPLLFCTIWVGEFKSLGSGEDREPQFLFQRLSVVIQCFNAVLLHDGFFVVRPPGFVSIPDFNFLHFYFLVNIPTEA